MFKVAYPLVMSNKLPNMAIEMSWVFPLNMVIFQFVILNYQRVSSIKSHKTTIFLWFSYGFPMVLLWCSYGVAMVTTGNISFRDVPFISTNLWPTFEDPLVNQKSSLVGDLPLWKRLEFVNWDDDIPNIYIYIYIWIIWEIKVMFQSQPTRFRADLSIKPGDLPDTTAC